MPTSRNNRETLHTLNALLAIANGSDRELVRHIHAAIDFEVDAGRPLTDSLATTLPRLLALHQFDADHRGFAHVEINESPPSPLWIRSIVLQAMRTLAGHRHALLLISGLRGAFCPPGQRWTPGKRTSYRQTISYIEDLAAAHCAPSTTLHLIFI